MNNKVSEYGVNKWAIPLFLTLLLSGYNSYSQTVTIYQTTKDGSQKLSKRTDREFSEAVCGGLIVNISGDVKYQTMDGFGAAMTGSSAYLINQEMNSTQRENLMNSLFGPGGIQLSFVRHSIGASDFSLSDYTYHDDKDMPFSISEDMTNVIPMLQLAKTKMSSLKIMGSPWTAPAWMKNNDSMKEGSLKEDHYDDFALYLVRYMEAFSEEGLPIYAITMQNEPLHTSPGYPSMRMEWYQQSNLLRYHLGPLMMNRSLDTKVILYDHNWDVTDYAKDILSIPQTAQYAAGTAFHGYNDLKYGTFTAQDEVYQHDDTKGIWFTEQSGGDWSPDFDVNLSWYSRNLIIGSIRNWSKSVILWNLALDTDNGPKNGGCSNCRGVVTVNGDGSYTEEVEYYVLGHLSKFVDPGARRVKSNNINDIQNVAFVNPDDSYVLVAYNTSGSSKYFKVRENDMEFSYTIPGEALVTFKWDADTGSKLITEVAEIEITEEFNQDFLDRKKIDKEFSVDLSAFKVDTATLTIVDMKGQVVYEHQLSKQLTKIEINDSLLSGAYIAYLDGENLSKKMRIVIR